jgi:integrase
MSNQRRSSGEGSVFQRQDGRWSAIIDLGYVNGKRKRKTIYGKTKKEVTDKLRQLQQEQAQGKDVGAERRTVQQFLEHWLEKIARRRTRPLTSRRYEELIRLHIVPHIGRVQLDKLNPDQVQDMLNTLHDEGLAPRTVHHVRAVLRTALNAALRFGYVTRNVAALVDAPKVKQYQASILTPDQALTLLNTVKGHRLEALYRVALSLALRRGEILALRWADVDYEQKTLRISKSKNESGARTLPLPPALMRALQAHWSFQQQERLAQGLEWQEHGLVFPSEKGTPLLPSNLHRHFKLMLKKAGLPQSIRFHDMRHSCASFLVAQGEHPRTVMHVLRHTNIQMSMEVYAKVFPEMEREALEKLDRLLNDSSELEA